MSNSWGKSWGNSWLKSWGATSRRATGGARKKPKSLIVGYENYATPDDKPLKLRKRRHNEALMVILH